MAYFNRKNLELVTKNPEILKNHTPVNIKNVLAQSDGQTQGACTYLSLIFA